MIHQCRAQTDYIPNNVRRFISRPVMSNKSVYSNAHGERCDVGLGHEQHTYLHNTWIVVLFCWLSFVVGQINTIALNHWRNE